MFSLNMTRQLGKYTKIVKGARYLSSNQGISRQNAFCAILNSNRRKTEPTFPPALLFRSHHSGNWERESSYFGIFGVIVAGAIGGTLLYTSKVHSAEKIKDKGGERRLDLKNIRISEVRKHNSKENGIWVMYKQGVYDITKFVDNHPGGDKVLLAAGGELEPFWDMYTIHRNQHTLDWLESYRIGNLHPEDIKERQRRPAVKLDDPFGYEPTRHPALRTNSARPFTAEPPFELLADNFVTPSELFFVRNHLGVPNVDTSKFKLEVQGKGVKKPITLNLDELKKKYKQHTITSVVQCAGNRRAELSEYKPVKGVSWGIAAISNATWTGVKLSDVLASAGVSADDESVQHIHLTGLDNDTKSYYEASIPAAQALDANKDVLLAWDMNGKPLTPDHGYPLRCVVPGTIGARQVKWLCKVTVSDEESKSHWQQNDYKQFNPTIDWGTLDYKKAVPIQEYPVQSAICEPKPGSAVDDDEVTLKGYAYSGGGRGILRVDVSIDGGKTWQEAQLENIKQPVYKQWAWTLWEATVEIPQEFQGKKFEVLCKATDTAHNTQPEFTSSVWNVRGLINNAWHRVGISHQQT